MNLPSTGNSVEHETSTAEASSDASETADSAPTTIPPYVERFENRNILLLALHQITLRVAWVFKTESVVMPAFVDAIAGPGWVRGMLPVFNRFGQSVPPLLFAETLRRARFKRNILHGTTIGMAVPFLIMAGICGALPYRELAWLPAVFLLLYALFFCVTGLHQLSFGTLQGKLIRAKRRGLLLSVASVGGTIPAIIFAFLLMPGWLARPDGGFGLIFAFTGFGFLVSACFSRFLFEEPDDTERPAVATTPWKSAWRLLKEDPRFRRAAIVSSLMTTGILLFPHYQALARATFDLPPSVLMIWVVAQNIGTGIFALVAGRLADRCGNRLAVRLLVSLMMCSPVLAVALTYWEGGGPWFAATFFLLGLTPVSMRTIANYTLELTEPEQHPQYVSTMSLCQGVPFLCSPLLGLLVDLIGFTTIFLGVAGLLALALLGTFHMAEPRDFSE